MVEQGVLQGSAAHTRTRTHLVYMVQEEMVSVSWQGSQTEQLGHSPEPGRWLAWCVLLHF